MDVDAAEPARCAARLKLCLLYGSDQVAYGEEPAVGRVVVDDFPGVSAESEARLFEDDSCEFGFCQRSEFPSFVHLRMEPKRLDRRRR